MRPRIVRRGLRRSFRRRSMNQTVIVGVAYATLLAAVWVSSLAASLPSNIVWGGTQLPAVRAELNKVAGQDFAFFTRSPETNEIDAYRFDPDGTVGASLRVTPQAKAANLLGLSRTQRAQGPELAILLHGIPPDGWIDCTELDRPACVDAASRHPKTFLRNNSPVPTVCGQVALTVESTTKWAYRRLTETRYSIERIAATSIDCIHRP
jgi:antimicrobial peptide system SdpA family protein